MQLFVTGATGVLGQAVMKRLSADGHAVHVLHGFGAQPIEADLFDRGELVQALAGCEAILHLATRIASTSKMAKRASWYENDHIRREDTRTLVEAALTVGVHVIT
jgi:nucleoside-diphosphate-sugar epimerase